MLHVFVPAPLEAQKNKAVWSLGLAVGSFGCTRIDSLPQTSSTGQFGAQGWQSDLLDVGLGACLEPRSKVWSFALWFPKSFQVSYLYTYTRSLPSVYIIPIQALCWAEKQGWAFFLIARAHV